METNKKMLGKINTQRCSVTLTLIIYLKGKAQQKYRHVGNVGDKLLRADH